MSTLRRTSSAASAGRPSCFPSAHRHSMTMFFPSTYPSSRRPCRNASVRAAIAEGEAALGNPIRGTFFGCCAEAETQSAKSMAQRGKAIYFFLHVFFLCLAPLDTGHVTLAPSHLITLSALASTFGGIVRPICLAVFRLMMNSNLVGCSTGRSAGLAPLRILST